MTICFKNYSKNPGYFYETSSGGAEVTEFLMGSVWRNNTQKVRDFSYIISSTNIYRDHNIYGHTQVWKLGTYSSIYTFNHKHFTWVT